MNQSGDRATLLIPVAISICLGIFFRFHNLDRKVYWNDEIWTSLWLTGRTSAQFAAAMPAGTTTSGDLERLLFTPGNNGALSTVAAIAAEDPKQPALYMLLARLWAGAFGGRPGTVRALSAVLSLLVLIPLYGLCRELFPDRRVAFTAVGLAAVSPFHILYAQEARPYSLWILALLASSVLLLRALRRNSRLSWILYGLSLLAGLLAHTLFALSIAGHGLFILSRRGGVPVDGRRAWMGAAATGVGLFLPWALLMVVKLDRLAHNTGWVIRSSGFAFLFGRWATSLASPFVDFGPELAPSATIGFALYALAVALTLGLLAYSVAAVLRESGRSGFFLVTLILPAAACLMLPDLLLGGGRMSTLRFLAPLLVGAEIAVAYGIATRSSRRAAWNGVLLLLITAGLASDYRSDRADTWWTKYLNAGVPEAAHVVNASRRPLVIGRSAGLDQRRLLSLCGPLRADVEIALVGENEPLPAENPAWNERDVFYCGAVRPDGPAAPAGPDLWRLGRPRAYNQGR